MRSPSASRRVLSLALLAGSLTAGAAAQAQAPATSAPVDIQARQAYDIPPGPLGKTIARFALASGISLASSRPGPMACTAPACRAN